MKYNATIRSLKRFGRSREGAWIEIFTAYITANGAYVAPARERGLKLHREHCLKSTPARRSREGAWIEINF